MLRAFIDRADLEMYEQRRSRRADGYRCGGR
jgi:hypothetical protein